MSSRIEIELTSQRSESEWTWRAAGAKQPKGVLSSSVLYEGAKVGDVARAEADIDLDGITILAVAAPQGKKAGPANRLEVVGTSREFQGVTTSLVAKGDRRKGRRSDERGDRDRRGERTDRGERGERKARSPRGERPARPEAPTFKKLAPKDDNRRAVLDGIAAEHRPIAEQVLRGGIPAVRQAIEGENAKAKEEGRPEVNAQALIAVAEELLPRLKAAEWMDKAQAAKSQVDEISVRDLRAVVSGADAVARTEDTRLLAAELREALERRTVQAREAWVQDITSSIEGGRVVRALRLSARPPDPQAKFPAELMDSLKVAAQEAMAPDTPAERWMTLLDAVGYSPVRRSVQPVGLPAEPGEALLTAAKQAAGRIPALAKQLGVSMPPPPRRTPKPAPPKPAVASASVPAPSPAEAATSEQPTAEATEEAPAADV